jgi:hypothetical protein
LLSVLHHPGLGGVGSTRARPWWIHDRGGKHGGSAMEGTTAGGGECGGSAEAEGSALLDASHVVASVEEKGCGTRTTWRLGKEEGH